MASPQTGSRKPSAEERIATVIVAAVIVLWVVFFAVLGYFNAHHAPILATRT